MTRVGSQLVFCSPAKILRRTVVERNEENFITQLFSLDENNVEPSQTLFFDGILSAEIISIKQSALSLNFETLVSNYNYFDFSYEITSDVIKPTDKPLVLDFGTNSLDRINLLMYQLDAVLSTFTIFEIIAACTYYPALILGQTAELEEEKQTGLLLWENVNLTNKCLTIRSKIRKMN